MFASKDLFFTKPSGGYQISRSVRLRSSASAYFSRSPASAGNRTTWTWSGWLKLGQLATGTNQAFFAAGNGTTSDYLQMAFDGTTQALYVTALNSSAVVMQKIASSVYRDPSAWYHVVFAYDSTQATSTNRIKIYVNGVQITSFSTNTDPALNLQTQINSTNQHTLSSLNYSSRINYFDGYMTEVNFIDGQQLTPSSFGQTNSVTGVWQPIKYTGTYGTNGFYLNFSDNSAATAAAIGKDYSGNGNNWTPNNISVTSGVTYDSMIDVPTLYADGGNGRGNYSVLNALDVAIPSQLTLSDGNLTATQPSTGTTRGSSSTFRMSTGKWYFEGTTTVTSGTQGAIGIADNANASVTYGIYKRNGSTVGLTGSPTFATYTNGDTIGVAFDADARTVSFYKNGTLQGTGGYTYTGTDPVGTRVTVDSSDSTGAWQLNYGQRPFTYTPPSGFVALNTQNLPTPTISNGANYMAATLYSGTGAVQSISNAVNGISFQPDLAWIKGRNNATDHQLVDSVRGTSLYLSSNLTSADATNTTAVTAFGSGGLTFGNNSNTSQRVNYSGDTYVGWQWQAGKGSTSSNTSGTITSTVSVNATAGFSVVTGTGTASGAYTVGHGLGVVPAMIILKDRSVLATNWGVWHKSLTSALYALQLNTTTAQFSNTNNWNNTLPTSTVFSTVANAIVNPSSNFVAYCFAAVAGYSAFGSYTGNGSADGPFVFTNFQPRWVMVKRTDSTSDWYIWDTSRDTYNVEAATLLADTSGAETSATSIDGLSNGFKCRSATVVNASGGTYIYAAFASNPYKLSLAR